MGWIADRLGLAEVAARARGRQVPVRPLTSYTGYVLLVLLLWTIGTGLLLLLYYRPEASEAHESIRRIAGEVPFGELIRNAHAWSSDLFIAVLGIHLLGVLLRRAFKRPHELVWLTGLCAFVAGVALASTGATLPWNEVALVQARVSAEIAGNMPLLGTWLRRFLLGGENVTDTTLHHLFGFHVAVLPAALVAVLMVHFMTLRPVFAKPGGAGAPAAVPAAPPRTIPIYPDYLVRLAIVTMAVNVVVLTLATFLGRAVGDPAVIGAPSPAGARPPWYFLPIDELARLAPPQILGVPGAQFLVGSVAALFALSAALPFLDRKGSRLTAFISAAVALAFVGLTIHAIV